MVRFRAALEPERKLRAYPDGLAGGWLQAGGHVAGGDDREAPVVQTDQLGEDLGAQAAPVAGDGVDPKPDPAGHRFLPGVSIVSAIAHAHGGRATASNPPGGGAVVALASWAIDPASRRQGGGRQ